MKELRLMENMKETLFIYTYTIYIFEFFSMRTKPCFKHKWLLCFAQSLIHMLKFQWRGISYIIIICIVFGSCGSAISIQWQDKIKQTK